MVCLDTLIFAKVSFFSGHKTSATRTMHSFTNSSFEKGFDFLRLFRPPKSLLLQLTHAVYKVLKKSIVVHKEFSLILSVFLFYISSHIYHNLMSAY